MSNLIPILTLEAQLKRAFRSHLRELGFTRKGNGWLQPPADDKEAIRVLHQYQRNEKLEREDSFIQRNYTKLIDFFADGNEVDPERIRPVLVKVDSYTVFIFIPRLRLPRIECKSP